MDKKIRSAIAAIAFMLSALMLFGLVQSLLLDKSSYGLYRNYKAQENVDILVFGNSHANGAVDAAAMEEYFAAKLGADVDVFNYSVFGMRMEQAYFFAKEAFKTHSPDLVILESYTFCPIEDGDREILARRAFDALPLSLNKIEAINYCVFENRWSYYVPLAKYHSRWKELSAEDASFVFDKSQWAELGKLAGCGDNSMDDPGDGWFEQDMGTVTAAQEITPSEKECFERFLRLLDEHGAELFLLCVPFKQQMGLDSFEMTRINNYLRENYCNEDIRLLDMNLLWEEMDFSYADLENEGHVNRHGADKVSAVLFPYLCEYYDIPSYGG